MEKTEEKSPVSLLREFAKPYQGKYIVSVVMAVLGVFSGLIPYFAAARIIVGLLGGERELQFYLIWCVVAAAGYIGRVLFSNWSTIISHTATYSTLRDIRQKLVSKLSRMPMGALLDTPSGRYKDVIVDRVEGLEPTLAHLLPEMTANLLVPLMLIVYLFVLDWRMALVSLITLPVGMVFMMIIMKTYPAQYAGSVEAGKRMSSAVVEYIGGIEVIKAFNQSARSYRKYSDAVNDNAAYFYNWMKSCQLPMSAYTAICPATLTTVLPIGFLFYANGSLPAADFVTVIILSLGIVGPILAATSFTDNLAIMGTVVQQTGDILSAPELERPAQEADISDLTIALKNVSFSYHENGAEPALRGVSLTIRPGTVTALVGPSGGGKSTVARLLAGFWDVTEGEITIGGVNLKDIPQRQLADLISYVAQDNYLFDDTVRENIRMGRRSASTPR